MVDALLVTSVFDEVKIAEPPGICDLGAVFRAAGYFVRFLELSVDRLSVEQTAKRIFAGSSRRRWRVLGRRRRVVAL